MATVTTLVRSFSDKTSKSKVLFRLRASDANVYYTSNLLIDINQWDSKKGTLNNNVVIVGNTDRRNFLSQIEQIKSIILKIYERDKNLVEIDTKWLKEKVEFELNHPESIVTAELQKTFFEWFDDFITKSKISDVRRGNLRVIKRCLQRYEKYRQIKKRNYKLDIHNFTVEELYDIEDYIINEYKYIESFPKIYKDIPECRKPSGRGENTKIDIMKKIHTFVRWVKKWDESIHDPFLRFNIGTETYGTPVYINLKERDQLNEFDFSYDKEKELIRDVFIFQCVIGCRVGDLFSMTKDSLQNGFVEYIQGKTKDGNPKTVRVPLNTIGMEKYNKYNNVLCKTILPFPTKNRYNEVIKEILKEANINRVVTVLNPRTRVEEHKPIYQVVSTHMARRTFIGNIFKKAKDKTVVSNMTGHAPNSRAFNRYVDIDDEIKLEVIKLID